MKAGKGTEVCSSRELIQSYIFSTMRHRYGIHGQRTLLWIALAAQHMMHGLDFRHGDDTRKIEVDVNSIGDRTLEMPLSFVMDEGDRTNYTLVKKDLEQLTDIKCSYECDGVFRSTHLLKDLKMDQRRGWVRLQVADFVWEAIMDFTKGFRKIDLEVAVRLRSVYSLRLYQLMSFQTEPLSYSLDGLKMMFGIEGKYTQVNDFFRKVLEPARRELDEIAPFSFTWKPILDKDSKVGRKRVTGVRFFPVDNSLLLGTGDVRIDNLMRRSPGAFCLDRRILVHLCSEVGMTDEEIEDNHAFLYRVQHMMGVQPMLDLMSEITARGKGKARNLVRYVMGALRLEMEE